MDGSDTKERIVEAAIGVFAARGFRDATVRDICAAAGVNVSMVNYHFDGKERLYAEVVRRLFSFALRDDVWRFADDVRSAATWRRAVRRFVEKFLGYMSVTEAPGVYTARIFRWEVTRPSSICQELQVTYGKLVYSGLERLLALALGDDRRAIKLWSASIWSRMAIFALADDLWLQPFAPEGMSRAAWIAATADQICHDVFSAMDYVGRRRKPEPKREKREKAKKGGHR